MGTAVPGYRETQHPSGNCKEDASVERSDILPKAKAVLQRRCASAQEGQREEAHLPRRGLRTDDTRGDSGHAAGDGTQADILRAEETRGPV